MKFTRLINQLVQLLGAIAVALPEFIEVLPPGKVKLGLQGLVLIAMAITGAKASNYHPDGTKIG